MTLQPFNHSTIQPYQSLWLKVKCFGGHDEVLRWFMVPGDPNGSQHLVLEPLRLLHGSPRQSTGHMVILLCNIIVACNRLIYTLSKPNEDSMVRALPLSSPFVPAFKPSAFLFYSHTIYSCSCFCFLRVTVTRQAYPHSIALSIAHQTAAREKTCHDKQNTNGTNGTTRLDSVTA